MREVIPAGLAGERLDRVVAMLAGCSRAEAAALVASGAVSLGDRTVTGRAAKVAEGDVVDVAITDAVDAPPVAGDASVTLAIVYEDADVIVVDKQPGLVVHPGAGNPTGTLVQGLLARHPEIASVGEPARPGVVHRIDKGTSGLLVVARSQRAYESLVAQLAARTVTRSYLALVWGRLGSTQGLVDAPIGRSARTPTRMAVSARGREARTRYEVERQYDEPVDVALLRCRLETGRTHQIRVHLAAIGHPVVGDARYGGSRQSLPAPRPWLHAAHLGFLHPATGEPVAFDAALPADLEAVLAPLR